ncbi:metallopeptidase TldD-related protein [Sulfuracidifex tepidarius]|nr:metallopeptidase TldD-related protein [Sulfuracidifex tepidarius]
MKVSNQDKDYLLPPGRKVDYLSGVYYSEVEEPFDKVKEYASYFEGIDNLKINYIQTRSESFMVKVVSTEGVDVQERRTFVSLGVAANTVSGSEVSPEVFESRESRRFDIDLDEVKETLKEKTEITSNRTKTEVKGLDVTFTTSAQEELIFPLINFSFSGENFYRKRSIFYPGEDINPKLRITDSPRREDGVFSRSFDAEGMPTQENVLVESSAKTFLTNYYWSRKASLPHTSSASRNFTSLPSISVTNLVIEFKEKSKDVREGTVVVDKVQGVHTSNPETGEFSVVGSVAWLDDGKKRVGLREIVLTGNIKTLLKNVVSQSSPRRCGSLISGDLRVSGISLII